MNAFAGACRWGEQSPLLAVLQQIGEKLPRSQYDRQSIVSNPQAGLVQRYRADSPETFDDGPVDCPRTGCLIAADARIDNREELLLVLDLAIANPTISDTELILACYLRWGELVAEKIIGDFAFAIWDPRNQQFFCARDRMGVRPLYYLDECGYFACASQPAVLLVLPGVSSRPDEQSIACSLLQILPDDTATFYDAVKRLPPGCTLKAGRKGISLGQYWSPLQVQTISPASDQQCAETFLSLFSEAIRCRMRSSAPVGSTLSGGLDSSSISCLAAQLLKESPDKKLHCFSATFSSLPPAMFTRIDEQRYMKAVSDACDLVAHELRADSLHPFITLTEDLRSAGQPFFGPNMYIHNGMYEMAERQGIRVLLDGIDGDSVVSYGFERLPQLLLTGRWAILKRELADLKEVSASRQSLSRLLWQYSVKPVLTALAERVGMATFLSESEQRQRMSLLRDDFKRRVDVDDLLHRHRCRMRLPVVDAGQHHRVSLALPFLSHILEVCTLFSTRYGVEPRFPFLDHRLVSYCLSLPPEQKLSGGWSRVVQRRAMKGIVPEPVLKRVSKADLSSGYYHGLVKHGPRLLQDTLRPSSCLLAEYLDIDRLFPRLQSCFNSPEKHADTAIFFFTVACLTMWQEQLAKGLP